MGGLLKWKGWFDQRTVAVDLGTGLHDWIATEATRQNRTVAGQINHVLQAHRKRMERGMPVIRAGSVVSMVKDPG